MLGSAVKNIEMPFLHGRVICDLESSKTRRSRASKVKRESQSSKILYFLNFHCS